MIDGLNLSCPVDFRDRVFLERSLGRLAVAFRIDFGKRRDVISPDDFVPLFEAGRGDPESIFRRVMQTIGARGAGWASDMASIPPIVQRRWDDFVDSVTDYDSDPPVIPGLELLLPGHLITIIVNSLFETESPRIAHLTDQPWCVDLYAVLMGAALYRSNGFELTNYKCSENETGWSLWPTNSLSQAQLGYAIAVETWLRHEPLARWSEFLDRVTRDSFERGLHSLEQTGSSLLDREQDTPFHSDPGPIRIAEDLCSRDAAQRLNALLCTRELHYCDRDILVGIGECLHDDLALVKAAACYAAAQLGASAMPLFDYVARLTESSTAEIRLAAVDAVAAVRGESDESIRLLTLLADDDVESIARAAIRGLLSVSEGNQFGIERSMIKLQHALNRGDGESTQFWLKSLSAHVDDVSLLIDDRLRGQLDDEALGVLQLELAREEP
jgi:hypothetical protein